jgi:hypothetical protein
MKLGLFNLMTQRDASITPRQIMEDTTAMVKLADEVGFDIAWFAEHHFSNYSICPSPLDDGLLLRWPDAENPSGNRRPGASPL